MITVSAAWRNSAQLSKKAVALVRLHYGDETNYITIASGSIKGFDEEYRPMLLSSPVSTTGVDMFTHKFQASDISLRVSNGNYHPGVKFSDLVNAIGSGNDIGFENRQCEIRLWTKGMTTWSECVQFFNGVVREIAHSPTEIIFSIQDKREIIHKDIGTLMVNTDGADGVTLPAESQGKTRPIIYGTHFFFYGDYADATNTTSLQQDNPVPSVYLGVDTSGLNQWLISEHQVFSFLKILGRNSAVGRYVELVTPSEVDNSSSGAIISHALNPAFYDSWYGDGTVSNENNTAPGNWQNDTQANDKELDAFALSEIAAGDGVLTSARIDLDYSGYTPPVADGDISEVEVYAKHFWTRGSNLANANVVLSINLKNKTAASSPDTLEIFAYDTEGASQAGVHQSVEIRHDRTLFGANRETTARIYEVWKRIEFTDPNQLTPVFFAGQGREYNESTGWITGRTDTEPHADNGAGGSTIENPAGAIESIYRDELGRVDADIDDDSFNVASNDISTMKFAFYLNKITKSLPLISQMARECRSFIWLQPDGTIKMKTLEDEFSASDASLDFKTLINPKISRTKSQRIYTAVNVNFGDDGTGAKNKTTGVAEDTVYQTKYNLTEAESTLTFEAKHIADSTTAATLRAYLLAQWKQPHNQLEFGVGLEHIDLDIGDILEFRNMPFKIFGEDITDNTVTRPSGEQVINKYWWIYNVTRSLQGATIKVFQLHKLN